MTLLDPSDDLLAAFDDGVERLGYRGRLESEVIRAGLAAVLPVLIGRVEGPRGTGLCDCADTDSAPTSWRTGEPMDHHCDCRAVEAAAVLLGGRGQTRHHTACGCGTQA